jgi:hypothetical protein
MTTVFISSPYSHPDADVLEARTRAAGDLAAYLWRERGMLAFSPIAHWHEIGRRNHLPGHAKAWAAWNRQFVRMCDLVHVLCIDGWDASIGVAMEIEWAHDFNIPVIYVIPNDDGYRFSDDPPQRLLTGLRTLY